MMTEKEYRSHPAIRLRDLIPPDELHKKLTYGDSELESNFLCFEGNYYPLSEVLPRYMTIVDCGCYQAAQCYFFRKFKRYIGVDCYGMYGSSEDYIPPLRFKTKNTKHIKATIQQFLEEHLKNMDLENTFFIASAVPDFKATQELFDSTENCAIFYPMLKPKIKGDFVWEIQEAIDYYRERI